MKDKGDEMSVVFNGREQDRYWASRRWGLSLQVFAVASFLLLVAFQTFPLAASATSLSLQVAEEETAQEMDGHSDSAVPLPAGADTPEAAGLEFFMGLLTNDQERVKAVCINTDEVWELTAGMLSFANEVIDFRRRFIEAYGRVAWDTFNDENHQPGGEMDGVSANGSLTVMELSEFSRVYRDLKLSEELDQSSCRFPGTEDKLLVVVKKEGRWFVDLAKSTPVEDGQVKDTVEFFAEFQIGVEKGSAAIGLENVTADQIDFELGRLVMMKMNMMDLPPRNGFTFEDLPEKKAGPSALSQKNESAAKESLNAVLFGGDATGYESLHTDVQKITLPAKFEKQVRAIRSALDGIALSDVKIEFVEPATEGNSWQVVLTFEHREQVGLLDLYLFQEKLVGLRVLYNGFAADTRFASRGTETLSQNAKTFFAATMNHDVDKAVSLFPDDPDFKQTFLAGFEQVLETEFNDVKILAPTVRIQWPPQEEGLSVACWQMCQWENDGSKVRVPGHAAAMLAGDGLNSLYDVDLASTDEQFYIDDLAELESTLRAFSSGELDSVLKLMSPDVVPDIEKAVFGAYLKNFSKTFGELKSVDFNRASALVDIKGNGQSTQRSGLARFANREMSVEIDHIDGWLDGFTFYEANEEGWQETITDLDPFVERGKVVCKEFFDGHFEELGDLCHESMRDNLLGDIETWQKRVLEIRTTSGELQGIVAGETEYLPEEVLWRCHYQINFGKGHFKTYVDFVSTPYWSEVINLNYSWFGNEDETPDDAEPKE